MCVQQPEDARNPEMKEMLEECGFIYYLILARLLDVDPKMYQKEGSFRVYNFLRRIHWRIWDFLDGGGDFGNPSERSELALRGSWLTGE